MPREEEFEYLPTQVVSEYLASCVEPHLDGIIFHSAQTDGEGRNVVLFNHAATIQPYLLPPGTATEFDMGWRSDDDYDDSITVWETVSAQASEETTGRNKQTLGLGSLFGAATWQPDDETEPDVQGWGEPTLKLDVENIQVFRIRAVSYQKRGRSVNRYRQTANEKSPI